MRSQHRMVEQGDHKQWSPEEHIRGCNDEEHANSSHALSLHPGQVASKPPTSTERHVIRRTAMTVQRAIYCLWN